jgi:hypothetical protein
MLRLGFLCLLLIALSAVAQQRKHDPLSDLEIDKVRDAALEPDVRLKLYIEFARARLDKLEQAKADTKAADRDDRMRDALQDFIDIYDELDDNVDTFADRDDDIRKALKPVIEADTEFGAKLRAFRSSLASSREGAGKFDFLAGTAVQAVDDGAKDHRDLLAEQQEKFKNKKEKPHKERSGGG